MKSFRILSLLLLAALALSCNGKDDPNNGHGTAQDHLWTHKGPLPSQVEVSSDGTLLETYEYTYDATGRILTLLKTDRLSGEVLLNLQYTYPSDQEMRITGKFAPLGSNRFIQVRYDPQASALTYSGSWSGAWEYTTTLDEGGAAVRTACLSEFSAQAGQYSAATDYTEEYTVSGGTLTSLTVGTAVNARSSRATRTGSASDLTVEYEASGSDDLQNFAAYLMPCSFPVWVGAGLPGNRKLIRSITSKTGSIAAPASTTLEYALNADGSIRTATRTDANAGTAYLVRTYTITYQ